MAVDASTLLILIVILILLFCAPPGTRFLTGAASNGGTADGQEHLSRRVVVVNEDVQLVGEPARLEGQDVALQLAGAGRECRGVVVLQTEAAILPSAAGDAQDANRPAVAVVEPVDDRVVLPGDCFGMDDHIRVSTALPEARLDEGLRRLTALAAEIAGGAAAPG